MAGSRFFSAGAEASLFFLEIMIPAGIIKSPNNKNPGKMI
jgi:hypothetical protein